MNYITPNNTFGRRLRMARIRAKLSMDDVCSMINNTVSKQSISKYEAGKMLPSDEVMIALSEVLSVNLDYFCRPFSYQVNDVRLSFRKRSTLSKKDINAMEVEVQDKVERYLEIEHILDLPDVHPMVTPTNTPISRPEEMREQAKQFRVELGLNDRPVENVLQLLEQNGIKVIWVDGPKGFDGVSGIVDGRYYIIALNNNTSHTERRRFTALHELGHLLFNDLFSVDLKPCERERLCHTFANEVLLPSHAIQHLSNGSCISSDELVRLQKTYGMSIDAIVHKLSDIGIMSSKQYSSFNIKKRMSPKIAKAVEQSRFVEHDTERFKKMVYKAFGNGLITSSKAAELLDCPVNHIQRYWRKQDEKGGNS